MSFMSVFPANSDRVQRDTMNAAEKEYADKHMNWFNTPKVVTVEQLKAHALKREAHELEHVIGHISMHLGLDQDVARSSKAEVRNAITKANEAMKDVNNVDKKKATNFLRAATNSLNKAKKNLLGIGKPMKRGARGGTLRRKSVKRCKS